MASKYVPDLMATWHIPDFIQRIVNWHYCAAWKAEDDFNLFSPQSFHECMCTRHSHLLNSLPFNQDPALISSEQGLSDYYKEQQRQGNR
jgi:hypothetical protein